MHSFSQQANERNRNVVTLDQIENRNFLIYQGFVEMMAAYLPDFSQIEAAKVYQWIVDLENEMSDVKKNDAENNTNDVSIK